MKRILFAVIALASTAHAQGELCGNGGTVCGGGEYCLAPPVSNCLPACLDTDGTVLANGSCNPEDGSGCADGWMCTTGGTCVTNRFSDACAQVQEGPCGGVNCGPNARCLAQFSMCMPVCLADGQLYSIGSCNPDDAASCWDADWICTAQGICVTPPTSDACPK